MKPQEHSFEKAFERLENILEQMNSQELSLDHSLKLYEEASSLITHCHTQLAGAEKKVEQLLKNRDQSLEIGKDGVAQTKSFQPEVEKATPIL